MTQPSPVVDAVARLRIPFPPAQVGHLPRAGVTLEYVGHGAVTSRLLDVDPEWNWEPLSFDEQGQPLFQYAANGSPVGLWIKLTVCGVTRLGFGSCQANQFDAEKVLIGDAIRNAAMRFGVALELWVKGHAEDDEQVAAKDDRKRPAPGKGQKRSGPPLCVRCGEPLEGPAKNLGGGDYAHVDCVEPLVESGSVGDVPNSTEPEQLKVDA